MIKIELLVEKAIQVLSKKVEPMALPHLVCVARSIAKLGQATLNVYGNQKFSYQGVQLNTNMKIIAMSFSFQPYTTAEKVTFNKTIMDENFKRGTYEQT